MSIQKVKFEIEISGTLMDFELTFFYFEKVLITILFQENFIYIISI